MQPKLKDIARELGVSTATVSNVLSGKGRVSDETRRLVNEKVSELGYRPGGPGRALRTGRSGVLGLVLPDISNPLFPAFAQAIEAAAASSGFGVLIADSHGDPSAQTDAMQRMIQRGADGIVIVPCRGTQVSDLPLAATIIDAASTPGNCVCSDHHGGGRLAVEHLLELGHRKMVFLGQSRRSTVQSDRIDGMQAALSVDARADVVWLEDGLPDFAALARRGATAVIATSDLHALTALTCLQSAGLTVPEDVSVIGFDDLSFSARIAPGLTTLAQDMPEIASAAVAHLMQQLDGAPVPAARIVPMALRIRGSTGPVLKTIPPQDRPIPQQGDLTP
ncbi:LacI family DNA-binding transcriptional regulator [Tropicimonas sp. TH_r6]|uniref:LacI family DNA-binding transcriptional regulator n=1 Tax=Tropicimonas sp. TH_r6 TaxID=3082085 RepID=UPI002954666B|nr:LacI family DNA-binding transcriptional regulator [Tropicimonas sp. TH_r6]MDV7143463.1 LacI family DNA-binding transcriptional regulator [Tropicimonas sp. TH_r6]